MLQRTGRPRVTVPVILSYVQWADIGLCQYEVFMYKTDGGNYLQEVSFEVLSCTISSQTLHTTETYNLNIKPIFEALVL